MGAAQPVPTRRASEAIAVIAAYSLLTVVFTYPQIAHLADAIGPHHDALFSIWRMSWIAHALASDPGNLLNANIFWPERHTLLYSDAMLLPGLLAAPALWAGARPVVVYNISLLATFVLCASAMYAFVRTRTATAPAATDAGIIFAFMPFRFGHYSHLEILSAWPSPLAFLALDTCLRPPYRRRAAIALGLAVAAQVYCSVYLGVFLVTALAIAAPFLIWPERASFNALLRVMGLAAGVCAILCAPYLWLYAQAATVVGERPYEGLTEFSPALFHFTHAAQTNWIVGRVTPFDSSEFQLFPGVVAAALALIGLCSPHQPKSVRLGFAAMLLAAVDLTRGVNGYLYPFAYEALLPFRGLRVPARMFTIVSLGVAVAAGFAAQWMERAKAMARLRSAALIALPLAVMIEFASMPLPLAPSPIAASAVYDWLEAQPRGVVMEWPFTTATNPADTHDPIYMFHSIGRWHPLANGYSGHHSPDHMALLFELRSFPTARTIELLRRQGVEYLVLHGEFAPEQYERIRDYLANFSADVTLAFGETTAEGEVTVFRLAPL
jgi:hypothetical protein